VATIVTRPRPAHICLIARETGQDIVLDAVLVPLINSATSIYAGFAIFSLLGHMAHEQGTTVSQVAGDGESKRLVVGSPWSQFTSECQRF
jgi:hypothetical protein